MEANAEVRVLGHVVRLPATDTDQRLPPEVVRGSAEGKGRASPHEPGQKLAEPQRVFRREPFGQEVLAGVVVRQLRLETDDLLWLRAECDDRTPELQRV